MWGCGRSGHGAADLYYVIPEDYLRRWRGAGWPMKLDYQQPAQLSEKVYRTISSDGWRTVSL